MEYLVKEGKKLNSLFFLTCFDYFIYTNRSMGCPSEGQREGPFLDIYNLKRYLD